MSAAFIHILSRLLFRLILSLLCLLLACWLILTLYGTPRPLTRMITSHLQARGIDVTCSRIQLSVRGGVVVNDLRYYGAETDVDPFLGADRVRIHPQWSKGFVQLHYLKMSIENATARWLLHEESWGHHTEYLVLSNASATVYVNPDNVRISAFSFQALGGHFEGGGLLAVSASTNALMHTRSLVDALKERGGTEQLRDLHRSLYLVNDARLEIVFNVNKEVAGGTTARINMMRGGIHYHQALIPEVQWLCRFHRGQWLLESLVLNDGIGILQATGSFTPSNEWAEARIESRLSADTTLALLPPEIHTALSSNRVAAGGVMACSLAGGPAPLTSLWASTEGTLSMESLDVEGVSFHDVQLAFFSRPDGIQVTNLSAVSGGQEQRNALYANFFIEPKPIRVSGSFHGFVDPSEAAPLVGTNTAAILKQVEVGTSYPAVDGTFSWSQQATTLWFYATCDATNIVFRGVNMQRAHFDLAHSNRTVSLTDIRMYRPEGHTEGWLKLDVDEELIDMHVESTFNPSALAKLAGPVATNIVAPFVFSNPVSATASGRIDQRSTGQTDFKLSLSAASVALDWLSAEQVSLDLRYLQQTVVIERVDGDFFEGRIRGDATIITDQPTGTWYRMQASFTNVNFKRLMERAKVREDSIYEGVLEGFVEAAGVVGLSSSVVGRCYVRMVDGQVFRLPIMGGLSAFLSRLVPGFGYLAQTEFETSGEIENGRIFMDNVQIEGSTVSVKARGSYHFDGEVDYRVRVQLLKGGPLAQLVRLVTLPISKLFEFRLTGTLTDPVWKPINLPKELFLIFD